MKKYGKLFCTFAAKDSFMKLKVLFIMNPISGTTSKDGIAPLIDKYIDSSKFDCQIRVTEYAGHAEQLARRAVADGVDVCVAVGGDGTVNEVGRAIVHSHTALGLSPVVRAMVLRAT